MGENGTPKSGSTNFIFVLSFHSIRVTDPRGATVSQARIKATDRSNSTVCQTTSDTQGYFFCPSIGTGEFRLTTTAPAFNPRATLMTSPPTAAVCRTKSSGWRWRGHSWREESTSVLTCKAPLPLALSQGGEKRGLGPVRFTSRAFS